MTQINEIIKKFTSEYELEPTFRPEFHTDTISIPFDEGFTLVLPTMNIRGRVGDYVSWFTTPTVFNNDWTRHEILANGEVDYYTEKAFSVLQNTYSESLESCIILSRYRPGIFQRIADDLFEYYPNYFGRTPKTRFGVLPVCHLDDKTYVLSIEDCTDILIFSYEHSSFRGPYFVDHPNKEIQTSFLSLEECSEKTLHTQNLVKCIFRDSLRDAIRFEKKTSSFFSIGIEAHFMNGCYADKKILALSQKLEKTTFPWTIQAQKYGFALRLRGDDADTKYNPCNRYYSCSKYNASVLESVLELYRVARIHKKRSFSEAFAEEKALELLHGMYVLDGWLRNSFLFHGLKDYSC